MYYLKTLFFNFFAVFFADHILSGIDVVNQTKLPHIGDDLIFAVALGFINSLIYPALRLFNQCSFLKILSVSLAINFVAYAALKLMPIGIHVTSLMGYFSAGLIVSLSSFLTNYLEMKHKKTTCEPMQMPTPEFHEISK